MTAKPGAFMAALQFSDSDLKANRQGDLSPTQEERIKAMRGRHSLIAAALFVILVVSATALIYLGQLKSSVILNGTGILLVVINAMMIGIMGRSYMRVGSDLRAGNVEMLEGEVERVVRRGRSGDNYLLRIDGADLYVSREVFSGFRHESPYHVYRTIHAGLLLSAEPNA